MGCNKHWPNLRAEAEDILLEAGAVYRCPKHEDVLLASGDGLAIWRSRAMAVELSEAAGVDQGRLLEGIRSTLESAASNCPRCKGARPS